MELEKVYQSIIDGKAMLITGSGAHTDVLTPDGCKFPSGIDLARTIYSACGITNPENPYDEYTFLGALRSSVRALRDTNPEIRIVLVTPTYTWYTEMGLTCEDRDKGGGILEEYVDAEIRAAEELGIEIIDVYHDFFPHEKWEDKDLYTRDGMHPNDEGRRMLAEKIAACLMTGR